MGINLDLSSMLPFLIPLAVIQIGLMIAALIHILTHKTYNTGNRILWVIISLCISIIGPVIYFCVGRSDGEKDDEDDEGEVR